MWAVIENAFETKRAIKHSAKCKTDIIRIWRCVMIAHGTTIEQMKQTQATIGHCKTFNNNKNKYHIVSLIHDMLFWTNSTEHKAFLLYTAEWHKK